MGFGTDFKELGPAGDFFAGTTVPIFTLISSIGVILTLRMQQKQLEMQGEELQNSIEEMQETRKVMIEQGETMTLQRFESTFFNMVSLHNEITKSLSFEDNKISVTRHGIETFRVLLDIARDRHKTLHGTKQTHVEKLQSTYGVIYHDVGEYRFGQYFRNLYALVKFVDEAAIKEEDKERYIEIIKAQLSTYESTVLLYHCFCVWGYGYKLLPLAQKYDLIANLDERLLFNDGDMDIVEFRKFSY